MIARAVRPDLRDRVRSIVVVDTPGGEATVLPGGAAVLGFQIHGRVRAGDDLLSPAGVTGVQRSARRYGYLGPTRSVLVSFTPQGVGCLGVPASEVAGRSVALDALVPGSRELIDRIAEARSAEEGAALVEDFLAGLPFAPDPLVERALRLFSADPDEGAMVRRVARAVSMSERQLERRFVDRVGSSPKRWASLLRFERAAALVRSGAPLAQAAQQAGYYDQPHFHREVRRFAGMTPGELSRIANVGSVQSEG